MSRDEAFKQRTLSANSQAVAAPLRKRAGLVVLAVAAIMTAAGALTMSGSTSDIALSSGQIAARSAAFAAVRQVELPLVSSAEIPEALKTMRLPDAQRLQLHDAVEKAQVKLVWLTLWDDRDEDGDVVEIRSSGFNQQVPLRKVPVRIAIPAPQDGIVNLRGIADGGGGITIAVKSGESVVLMPVMSVGQSLGIPVAP